MNIEIDEKERDMLIYALRNFGLYLEKSDMKFCNIDDVKKLMNRIIDLVK